MSILLRVGRLIARLLLALLVLFLLILFLPGTGPAHAKGPDRVTISGYGVEGRDLVYTETRRDIDANTIMNATGFWQVYGERDLGPAPELTREQLGPRYVLSYWLGETRLVQHVYPFAAGGAWEHALGGQEQFGFPAPSGWSRGSTDLRRVFVRLGAQVPPAATAEPAAPQPHAEPAASAARAETPGSTPDPLVIGGVLVAATLGVAYLSSRWRPGTRRTMTAGKA